MRHLKIILCLLLVLSFAACEGSTKSTDVSMFENEFETAETEYDEDEYDDEADKSYEEIYSEGYEQGHEDGQAVGEGVGWFEGYDEGYNDGYADAKIEEEEPEPNYYVDPETYDDPGCPETPEVVAGCWPGVPPDQIVFVSRTNTVHRRSNCSGMKYYNEMPAGEAYEREYYRCSKCW